MHTTKIFQDIDAIIFDLDGSLVDSMWIWPAVDIEYFAKYNLDVPEGFHEEMQGRSYTELAHLFHDTFPTLPCTVEEIKQEWYDMSYQKYLYEVPLKPGAFKMITYLRERGVKFGIATSNSRELVDAVLHALHVEELFDSIRTACEVKCGKPAPDVYLLVASDLGVEPEKCLVFEDIPKGILAGINAGMRVCAVDDETSRDQDQEKRELAHYYIRDYNDIINSNYEVL